jgi:hypothetical protein
VTKTPHSSLADHLPDPVQIHTRLGELSRERRLLRRMLSLALSAREERASRNGKAPSGADKGAVGLA